jgi:hypothetical protein
MRFFALRTTTNSFKTHRAWVPGSGLVQIPVSSMLRLDCTPSTQLYLRSTVDTALQILTLPSLFTSRAMRVISHVLGLRLQARHGRDRTPLSQVRSVGTSTASASLVSQQAPGHGMLATICSLGVSFLGIALTVTISVHLSPMPHNSECS